MDCVESSRGLYLERGGHEGETYSLTCSHAVNALTFDVFAPEDVGAREREAR